MQLGAPSSLITPSAPYGAQPRHVLPRPRTLRARLCVRRGRAQVEPEGKASALIQQTAHAGAGPGADSRGSGAMANCDFTIIDDDQDKPTENHMYMLQTLISPELTRCN